MAQRSKQKAESRAAIVSSAAKLVREHGGAGVSVQAAMAGAGLTVGTFYAHFPDKAALVDDAFRTAVGESISLIETAANGNTGRAALQDVIDLYLSELHRDTPAEGCPLPAMTGEAAAGDGSLDHATMASGVMAMADELRIVAPAATTEESIALLALMVGGQIIARALGTTPESGQVLQACRANATRLVSTNHKRSR